MNDTIQRILLEKNVLMHRNEGILVVNVSNAGEGSRLASDILTTVADRNTALFLSGGSTPIELYQQLAIEGELQPGVVGLVDERYGPKLHQQSNEKAIVDTGLLRYFSLRDIAFHPILHLDMTRRDSAQQYDEKVRSLFSVYPRSVTVMSVGIDGHTAGLPASASLWQAGIAEDKHLYVTDYNDSNGFYKERITMTFLGLSMIDLHVLLVFGQSKKRALDLMFDTGLKEDIPARFFKQSNIAAKTLLITDQNV